MNIEEARALWPVTDEYVYLYCAGEMPLAKLVRTAIEAILNRKERPHTLGIGRLLRLASACAAAAGTPD